MVGVLNTQPQSTGVSHTDLCAMHHGQYCPLELSHIFDIQPNHCASYTYGGYIAKFHKPCRLVLTSCARLAFETYTYIEWDIHNVNITGSD